MTRFTPLMLTFLMTAACAGTTPDVEDAQLDDEFGVMDFDRADSNAVVRPGTPEGDAVMAYVNQQIADDAAGAAFFAELDSKMHRIAAKNIVEARAGQDGTFGTADDVSFPTLDALDRVRYVGRVAMMHLFELADAAGYFAASSPCDGVIGRNQTFKTMDQLIELENSRCDHFTGDVRIDLRQTLLPMHRGLRAFDRVKEIGGTLIMAESAALENPGFRGLTKIGSLSTRNLPKQRAVLFPSIKEVDHLLVETGLYMFDTVEKVQNLTATNYQGHFPALKEATNITVSNNVLRGFDALETVRTLRATTTDVDGFHNLADAQSIQLDSPVDDMKVDAFDKLESVSSLRIATSGAITGGDFPALEYADTIQLGGNAMDFPRLQTVQSISIGRTYTGEFAVLKEAQSISVTSEGYPFPKLETVSDTFTLQGSGTLAASELREVGGNMNVSAPISTYNKLQSVGGQLTLSCHEGTWNGMRALTEIGSNIDVSAGDCEMKGLAALETLPGRVRLTVSAPNTVFEPLQNLEVSGAVQITNYAAGDPDFLPTLALADGDLSLIRTHRDTNGRQVSLPWKGLNALEAVEGNFVLSQGNGIEGLQSLTSVGGQRMQFPRQMSVADRDAFLAQITQFSGQIVH